MSNKANLLKKASTLQHKRRARAPQC